MALQDLKNETLGVKHKNYNKLVKDAIAENKTLDEKEFKPAEQDLENLMKIDIASNKKDVDYIISVLKSKDMLYVSRALKKSKWLVEDQYEHIINPQHLRDQVFPQMTTVAGIKLAKLIRQHLKNESRVEEFLKSETDPKVAAKWLSRCSIPFTEKNVQKYMHHLENLELKRLFEKSVSIFEAATNEQHKCYVILESASFLVNTHLNIYLDVVERVSKHERPKYNAKTTNIIMKQVSERIKEKFEIYSTLIHIPTFVKYFKSEEIKEFLYKQANKDDIHSNRHARFYKYATMKLFVSKIQKEEQFDFVKNLFIDKAILLIDENTLQRGTDTFATRLLCNSVCSLTPSYFWYEFAPFDIAFPEIKQLIHSETNLYEQSAMLKVLLLCTNGNMEYLKTVLTYYNAQHLKEEIQFKKEFLTNVVSNTDIHKYDDATWILLDTIIISMDVYIESASTEQNCLEIVIIHNLLKSKPIPEIIEKKFSFNTLKNYQKKLSKEEGNKVFDYLFKHAKKSIESNEINNQEEFSKAITWLDYLLNLLLDWNKALSDYPLIIKKIKEFIKIKKENNWKSDLSLLYNKNKSWRKYMFEESVNLYPTEDVCLNAIKHDPALLERYNNEVETICCNDAVSLRKLLNKLRIYWPNSLASDWSKSYVARLDKLGNHKALIRGICAMLPQKALNNIIKKYVPVVAKVDWSKTDELSLSLQRVIAKNMHIARPQPLPEDILQYAKGDYLQYALPSLLAIYYNLSRVHSKEQVPKLLDAPVSLQKHGIRLAFLKLDHSELKLHIYNIWKKTKNSSIRTVVFQLMFELLRKEKNDTKAQELWELLEVFIDNLSFQEDDKIYKLLPRVGDVPLCVRPKFLMKSYIFLKTLIHNSKKNSDNYQYHIDIMAEYTRDIMELMPPEFVADILTEFINERFFKFENNTGYVSSGIGMLKVLSAYLLCTKKEEIQMQRFEELLHPLIKRSLDMWNEKREGSYFMRRHIQEVLKNLLTDLNIYVIKNNMVIPVKMFTKIKNELQNLSVSENYLMLTMWKLTVRLTELIQSSNETDDWDKICSEIAAEFGKFCLDSLKEDVMSYFPCIYVLYAKALEMTLRDFPMIIQLQIFEQMLSDVDFIQAYLATLKVFPNYESDEDTTVKQRQLKKIIEDHPSVEVKMHYYNYFRND
ncbi:Uncharacterized protein OBRU01_16527 [Operophtera brumata]|uniref:Uncharacterized protein n=2 Tax=Operophtera brumata TaxID=104452 RepID=A0A0L7L1H1_OPEBR|nr:Uncharacterized protein OBRU01_16527 [Operophtera brumata]